MYTNYINSWRSNRKTANRLNFLFRIWKITVLELRVEPSFVRFMVLNLGVEITR